MLEGGFPNPQPVLNRLFHRPQSRDEIPARVGEPAFQHVALQFGKAEQGSSTFMSHTRVAARGCGEGMGGRGARLRHTGSNRALDLRLNMLGFVGRHCLTYR